MAHHLNQARRDAYYEATLRWRDQTNPLDSFLWDSALDPNQPKWFRRRIQRDVRAEQYATVEELDAHKDTDGRYYSGQLWARYRDSRGWLGVDRHIQQSLRRLRQSRRATAHTPWGTLLAEWTPERRCAHAFAVDASGQVVHHDDPRAVRWCLAGWLAHRCQKAEDRSKHFRTQEEREAAEWHRRTDDREARRLLDEVWALVPERTRAIVEGIRCRRLNATDRKRLDQHPLGYWYYLAPHLAERFLKIVPSGNMRSESIKEEDTPIQCQQSLPFTDT